MMKKILPAILIASLGFIINCGSSLQTGGSSPESLLGLSIYSLPPMISSVSPANNSSGVSTSTLIRILFAEDMLAGTISNATIILTDESNTVIPCPVTYNPATRTANVMAGILSNSARYTVTLTTNIMTTAGHVLPFQVTFSFTTVDITTVPAPEFTLMEGTYYGPHTTSITCSEPGSMISYTTDSTAPTRTNGLQVASPATVAIPSTATLKAMAYLNPQTKNDSTITTANYRITAAPPVFAPPGGTSSADIMVTLTDATPGATIYYTTDGSVPTTASALYSSAISVNGHGTTMTIRAIATAPGLEASPIVGETYSIVYNQASSPVFTPLGGFFGSDQNVSISCSTPGANIYYTTDGSLPTPSSSLYLSAIPVTGPGTSMTIRAIAVAAGYLDSPIVNETYTISLGTTAAPDFTPLGGSFNTDTNVTLSCTTPGAFIYYTTDGSAPTTSSSMYSAAVPVIGHGAIVTIRAIATAAGYSDSPISQQIYTVNYDTVTVPSFDIPAGLYNSPQSITISTPTLGATIRYSTDGGTTWSDGPLYTSSASVLISLEGVTTLQAFAYAPMMLNSTPANGNYTIDTIAPLVSLTGPANGARDTGYTPLINVTFNEPMTPSSMTTNVGSTICSGSLQLSSDGFATCVQMNAVPATGDNMTFTLSPAAPLDSGTVYKFKVTTLAHDPAGNSLSADYISPSGFVTEVSGFVDMPFGGGSGYVITQVAPAGGNDDEAQSVLVQPDGKILVAGYCQNSSDDYVMARYEKDGSVDSTFSGGGADSYDFGDYEYGYDIAIQSGTGRIILAGSSNNFFQLSGYNANGFIDNTFGSSGPGFSTQDIAFGEWGTSDFSEIFAMTVDSSDRIIAAGYAINAAQLKEFALVRFDPNGSLDTSFGGNGIATTSFALARDEVVKALAIQTNGKIIAAGWHNTGVRHVFAVARFNNDGSLDGTFNGVGKAQIDFGSNAEAESVAVYPDGRILLAGHTNNQIAMARLNGDGTMDATFNGDGNGDGMILVPFLQAGNLDWAYAAALQKNGKILVAGPSLSLYDYDIAVTRYLANGSLDPAFGLGGMNFFLAGSGNDMAYDMKLQPLDGRIVVTGSFNNGPSSFDIFVLRFK